MNSMSHFTQHGLAGTLSHEQIAAAYAGATYGRNFVVPFVFSPRRAKPYLDWMVILCNPKDSARIARTHVQKSDAYGFLFLGNGVLSTTDNPLWRAQRQHLVEAFLPEASLAHIFPVSPVKVLQNIVLFQIERRSALQQLLYGPDPHPC